MNWNWINMKRNKVVCDLVNLLECSYFTHHLISSLANTWIPITTQIHSSGLPRLKQNPLPRFALYFLGFISFLHPHAPFFSSLFPFVSPSSHFSRDKHASEQREAGTNQSIDLSTYPLKCPLWSSAENKVFIKRNLKSPSSSLCLTVPSLVNGKTVHPAQVPLPITRL